MLAGIGLGIVSLVFLREFALVAIQSAASKANELRDAVAILSGGRLQITIGVIMLMLAARMVIRARARAGIPVAVADGGYSTLALEERPAPPSGPLAWLGARTQAMLNCDVVWPAFVVGVASSAPPFESVVALTVIMASGAEIATQLGAFVVFTLLVLAVIEIPLVGYLTMPEKTQDIMQRLQDWVRTNRPQISLTVCLLAGILFVYQGVTSL